MLPLYADSVVYNEKHVRKSSIGDIYDWGMLVQKGQLWGKLLKITRLLAIN
jgi:hypothetical protein